jgi:hypothetical protein
MEEKTDGQILGEIALLAPAAGSGIGKAIADALISDAEFLPLMLDAAKDGLRASRSFWAKTGGDGRGELHNEPDMRIRTDTLFRLLAHMEGEPVKRIIHQHLGAGGQVDLLAALRESPALRDAAAALVEKADWKHSGKSASKRPKAVVKVEGEDAPSAAPESQ